MQKSLPLLVALLGGALAVAGCAKSSAGSASPDAGAAAPISVETVEVTLEDVERKIEVTGTLAPWEEAIISLEADGRLVKVAGDLGDPVRKGQLLALVASQEYEFRKVQTEADLAAAEADFKRFQDLAKKDMTTPQQLDESRRRVEVARTAADLARKKLQDASLVSPIDGVIARRMVNVGEYVRLGVPAFQVVRTMPLKLKADIPERYAAEVKVGAAVSVQSEALGERVLSGKIARISPTVAVDSRAFPIEAQIENPRGAVKPGTFVRASILVATASRALVVPEAALATFAGTPRVFVLEGGQARERIVETAGRSGARVIVAKGLSAGERVIVSGVDKLTDGLPVAAR